MALNPTATRRGIYGKLAGDTTLNNLLGTPAPDFAKSIYHQVAPDKANYPFVIFNRQAGTPSYAFTKPSALETDIWLVKAIDSDSEDADAGKQIFSADRAESIAARINALLTDAALSISGAKLLSIRRQSDVDYEETEDGVSYRHCGSLYRLVFELS